LAEHNKNYSNVADIVLHQAHWNRADVIISQINHDVDIKGKGARAGHNFTSDLTPAEFSALTGRVYSNNYKPNALPAGRAG